MLNHIHKAMFGDHVKLNAPDFVLSLNDNGSHALVFRYSDFKKLKEHNAKTPFPLPTRLYMVMDGHIGEYGIPKTPFIAITPFGMFDVQLENHKGEELKDGIWKEGGCVACIFGVFPCKKHIVK